MIKTILIEKEKDVRDEIKTLIRNAFPKICLEGEFSRLTSGMNELKMLKPELVLLDKSALTNGDLDVFLSNPTLDGARLLMLVQDGEAMAGFKNGDIFEYLTKPISRDLLKNALDRIISQVEIERFIKKQIRSTLGKEFRVKLQDKKIVLKTNQTIYLVRLHELIRCEADKNYTHCYLESGEELMVSKTLSDFDFILKDYDFVRSHKSHLVNLEHIQSMGRVNNITLIMSDNSEVPVSHRKREEIYRRISSKYLHF